METRTTVLASMSFTNHFSVIVVLFLVTLIPQFTVATLQATSSSFDLTLSPTRSGKHFSIKSETRQVLQDAITSTLVASSGQSDCPYQDMTVRTEHVEWVQPDYVKLRFFLTATIDETKEDRYGSSSYDRREELDAYILDNFYGDAYVATIQNESDDELIQVVTHVQLQVSENQSRIYKQPSPSSWALIVTAFVVILLFVVDVMVRYLTADACSGTKSLGNLPSEEVDGIFRDRL